MVTLQPPIKMMMEALLKTNLSCSNCVSKVQPALDEALGAQNWKVDLQHPDRILLLKNADAIPLASQALASAGFVALPICEPANIDSVAPPTASNSFWFDVYNWKRAGYNTLNCLIGCSIGDFSMMIYLQAFHPHILFWIMMSLAMAAGLATSILFETSLLMIKERFTFAIALRTAFAMSFISMLAMEFSENMTDFFLTGGGNVAMHEPFYWYAWGIALVVGFIVPLPYNYYKLKKYNRACH
jgi:copper chaperone CopZ